MADEFDAAALQVELDRLHGAGGDPGCVEVLRGLVMAEAAKRDGLRGEAEGLRREIVELVEMHELVVVGLDALPLLDINRLRSFLDEVRNAAWARLQGTTECDGDASDRG